MLFSIFVNDLDHLSENGCEHYNFNDAQIANFLKITVLLYADDTIVLADFVKGAKSIEFCKSILKGMKVTCERQKTKVMIFVAGNIRAT